MNLYEIAFLDDEQVNMFTSDFRIEADYFVQMRKNRNYVAPEATIKYSAASNGVFDPLGRFKWIDLYQTRVVWSKIR